MTSIRHPRCPYCHDDVVPGSGVPKVVCEGCHAFHHAECWAEGRGCSAGRCGDLPVPVRLGFDEADGPAPAPAPAPPVTLMARPAPAPLDPAELQGLLQGTEDLAPWIRRLPAPWCVRAAAAAVELVRSRHWPEEEGSPVSLAVDACQAWAAGPTPERRQAAEGAAHAARAWATELHDAGGAPGLVRLGHAASYAAEAAAATLEEATRRRAVRAAGGAAAALTAFRTGSGYGVTPADRRDVRDGVRAALLEEAALDA